jgi:hypothetical protein
MTQTQKQPVLPAISMTSEAFRDGWQTAMQHEECGWPTNEPPNEETIVQFLCISISIENSERLRGRDCEYGMRWIAGLLTGWLRRS